DDLSPSNQNVYHNVIMGATPNPVMPNPDAIDEAFAEQANQVLSAAVELVRELVGAHQSAIAIVVQKDWARFGSSSHFPPNMVLGQIIEPHPRALGFMPGCWSIMPQSD